MVTALDWRREVVTGWRPLPRQGGNEWAEANRFLSPEESGNKSGRWRSLPWQVEILDALADPNVERVVILKAAQVGASDVIRCAIGRWAVLDPGDVLWVMADKIAAEKAMKKLRLMFRNTPSLRHLVSDRRTDATLLELVLTNGMRIVIGWAGSPQSLASDPFRRVILDEVAKYKWNVKGGGSPVGMADERTKTFGRRAKVVLLSSPEHDDDQICKAFRETLDRRAFTVPCPDCQHLNVPEFESVRWPGGSPEHAPEEADARVRLAGALERDQSAWLACGGCEGRHLQPHRAMNAPGARWVQEEAVEGERRRAYHVPEFVHWQTTLSALAAVWLRCTHPQEIVEFHNGRLGKPYKSARTRIPAALFSGRATHKAKVVPAWATTVLSTVDTQLRGYWFKVRAWGKGGKSRLLDKGFAADDADLLERAVHAKFAVEGAPDLEADVFAWAIDTGGGMVRPDGSRTKDVYELVARTKRGYALKGRSDKEALDGNHWSRGKVPLDGGRELDLYRVNRNFYADELSKLINAPGPHFLWEECEGADEPEYTRQMASEELVLVTSGTKSEWLWQKRSKGVPNHYWDCARYQVWLADMARVESRTAPTWSRKRTVRPAGQTARSGQEDEWTIGR